MFLHALGNLAVFNLVDFWNSLNSQNKLYPKFLSYAVSCGALKYATLYTKFSIKMATLYSKILYSWHIEYSDCVDVLSRMSIFAHTLMGPSHTCIFIWAACIYTYGLPIRVWDSLIKFEINHDFSLFLHQVRKSLFHDYE